MKRILLTFLLASAIWSISLGATRYVSPNGSNTSPYETWAKAAVHPNVLTGVTATGDSVIIAPRWSGATPIPYDTVDIRPPRGGTSWTVYKCSASTLDAGRTQTILSSGWTPSGTWYQRGATNVYTYSATVPPRWNCFQDYTTVITQDGVLGHSVNATATIDETQADINQAGEYYYDDTGTDSIFFWPWGNGDPDSYAMRFSQAPVVYFLYGDQDRIKFEGLTLEMGAHSVVVLATPNSGDSDASDSIWFYNCNIEQAGDTWQSNNTSLIYAGLPAGGPPSAINDWGRFLHVVNCSLNQAWSPDDDLSGGFGCELYSQREYLIDNNWFGPDLRSGAIGLKNGGAATATWSYGGVISNNTTNGGKVGMWIGPKVDSLLVVGNYVLNPRYRGIDVHSTFSNVQYPGRIKIFNNTIYNVTGEIAGGEAITISQIPGDSTLRNEVKYNIIFDTATVQRSIAFIDQEATPTNPHPFWRDIDSNYYYHGASSFSCALYPGSGCTGTDWTAWQACGFDLNGSSTTNPNFTASQTPTLSRVGTSAEMNRTYAGQTWTRFGAWQPAAEGGGSPQRIRGRIR